MQGIDSTNFRLRLGADPTDPALAREAMALGNGAQEQLRTALAFEKALGEAMAIPIPPELAEQLAQIAPPNDPRAAHWFSRGPWLAMAASLLLVIGFASNALLLPNSGEPDATMALGMAAIEHLTHEPLALMRTETVAQPKVDDMLHKAGLQMQQAVAVDYANPCPVAGQTTVHMVVQQSSGPVSVIYFPKAEVAAFGEFAYGGTSGKTMPFGDGMLVLLGTDPAGIDAVQGMWQSAHTASVSGANLIVAN